MKNFIRYLIIVGLILISCNAFASLRPPTAFDFSASLTPYPVQTGEVTIEYKVKPNTICDNIHLTIDSLDNVKYNNSLDVEPSYKLGDTFVFHVNVIMSDTMISGLRIYINGCTDRGGIYSYFEPLQDTILFTLGDPRWYGKKSKLIRKSIGKEKEALHIQQFNEHKRKREMALNDTTRAWYYDSLHTWNFVDKDSLFMSLRKHRMTPKEKMLEMEESPLTYATQEDIVVEGKFYTRNKGEYKFRPLVALYGPDSDPTILQREDSIIAALPDSLFHLVFDLTDSEDFNYISNIVDQLEPMEQAGFYHALIWRSKIRFVEDREIKYNLYPKYPIDNSVPTNSQKKN